MEVVVGGGGPPEKFGADGVDATVPGIGGGGGGGGGGGPVNPDADF